MFYLFWAILNIAFFILFLSISYKCTRLVRQKAGLLAAVFFVFFLMSFVSSSNNEKDTKMTTWESPIKDDSLAFRDKGAKNIVITENLMFSIKLHIIYAVVNGIKEPYFATCSISGVMGGYDWKTRGISIQKSEVAGNTYQYLINAEKIFRLLSISVLNQYKEYNGQFQIE